MVWWGSAPYAPFLDRTDTFRLFEVLPPHPVRSQVALTIALAFAAWRFGPPLLAHLRTWTNARGGAIRGDIVAMLALVATLGYYPRARATRALLASGLAEFPGDVITWLGLAALGAGFSIMLFARAPALLDRVAGAWRRIESLSPRTFLALACGVAVASSLAVSLGWWHGLPVASDGVNYRFQANMFAHGHLTLPTPPVPNQFHFVSTLLEPRWVSIVNPGWSLLLVPGLWLGAPWLMNPLCYGGTVALLYALGRRWWNERTGRVVVLLALGSPFLLLPAGSHTSHPSMLLALLLFLWLWQRMADGNAAGPALLAGLVLGWAATIRPLDAAVFALPWGVWTCVRAARRQLGMGPFVLLGVGVVAPLLGLAWFNWQVYGDPTTFGYDIYYGGKLKLGFGAAPDLTYTPYPHTPARGVMNANNNLNALNKMLLGWPVPALGVALVALRARGRNVFVRLCAVSAALIFCAYFLFVHADFMYGARYYHAAAGALLLLAARGTLLLAQAAGPRRAAALALACGLYAGAGFYPPLLHYYRSDAPVFQGVQSRLHEALTSAHPGRAVVLIDAGNSLAYGSAVWRNGDGAESPIVFALDDGTENRALRAAFPDRTFYRFRSAPAPGLERLAD